MWVCVGNKGGSLRLDAVIKTDRIRALKKAAALVADSALSLLCGGSAITQSLLSSVVSLLTAKSTVHNVTRVSVLDIPTTKWMLKAI